MWLRLVSVCLLVCCAWSWSFFGSYDEPCDVCECHDGTFVFTINCDNKDLTYLPLQEDWKPPNENKTIIMSLKNNNIERIGRFPALKIIELYLSHNDMKEIEQQAFERLPVLNKLDLSHNNLLAEKLKKEVFQGPFSTTEWEQLPVEDLNLSYNNIHSLDKDVFDHLEHVKNLNMDNNPMKEIDHSTAIALVTLRKLERLSLAQSELVSVPDGVLNTFINLTELDLSGNQLTEVPPRLETTMNLKALNLNNNPIKKLTKDSFIGLKYLEALTMTEMGELVRIGKGTFSPLRNLRSLTVNFNEKLTVIDAGAFDGLTDALEEVSLRGNALKTISSDLLPWDTLSKIDIQDNPWLCDCQMKWAATTLIPIIDKRTPELTLSIMCMYPPALSGRSMAIVAEDPDQMKCDKSYYDAHIKVKTNHGGAIAAVVVIGMLFGVVAIVTVLAVISKKKRTAAASTSSQIRYQRAPNEDDKANIHSFVA